MVEKNLQVLEALLTREGEILQQFPTMEPGNEMEALLDELSKSLQQFQLTLGQLGAADLSSMDRSTLRRLQMLKQKRDQNGALLQEILQSSDKQMASLQVEKKTLRKYRPAEPKKPRLLDDER